MPAAEVLAGRLERVRATATLGDGSFARWRAARVAVAGVGALGSRFAVEAVRSGAAVIAIDPDLVEASNVGTQAFPAAARGRPKVEAVVAACDAIEPGRACALPLDVRAVGFAVLAACDLIADCTDAGTLALPLTMLSNALGIPLLRLAVDGSDTREMGRVLVSHGGAGHACQVCDYAPADLAGGARTPCPGARVPPPPTLAGAASALAIAGVGLLQAQRLLGGRGRESALDREILVDLDGGAMHVVALTHRSQCLSGHQRFDMIALAATAAELTVRDALGRARDALGAGEVTLTPFAAPLAPGATCRCGASRVAVRCVWSAPPACPRCRAPMVWRRDLAVPTFGAAQAAMLGILDAPLAALGLPDGALLTAHAGEAPPVRLLLRAANPPFCRHPDPSRHD